MEIQIKASEFKAKCLALMNDVEDKGDIFIITKNGRPIAQMNAITKKKSAKKKSIFGLHADPENPFDYDGFKKAKEVLVQEWEASLERRAKLINGEQ